MAAERGSFGISPESQKKIGKYALVGGIVLVSLGVGAFLVVAAGGAYLWTKGKSKKL